MNDLSEAQRLRSGAAFDTLPCLLGEPACRGRIRVRPEDFIVRERLAFAPSGEGEHLYLLVRKTGQNTRWVASHLARRACLSPRAVGYAGMKDRHAVTDQWFSLHLPGKPDPDLAALAGDGIELLDARRHSGKLRIGALSGNEFRLVVRDLAGDPDALQRRLAAVRDGTVPNYFGPQRFGQDGGNLALFGDLHDPVDPGRTQRSLGLSALRSALFNLYLAERLRAGTVARPLPGEIVHDAAGPRYRHVDDCADFDGELIPTGLLWGSGDNQSTDRALSEEQAFFAAFPATTALLESQQARMMRRPLLIRPRSVDWRLDADRLTLSFGLSRGQFATAVLRECLHVESG